jgi:hypothetical protein
LVVIQAVLFSSIASLRRGTAKQVKMLSRKFSAAAARGLRQQRGLATATLAAFQTPKVLNEPNVSTGIFLKLAQSRDTDLRGSATLCQGQPATGRPDCCR